jgi:8-oxo-dGTP diphosphatase
MTLAGQRIQPDRYTIIPRTITFMIRGHELLLIRIASDRGAWAGKLNGIGGHIEEGETPASAAQREIQEETGLTPEILKLCGVVIIDAGGKPGIGLYVFAGYAPPGELHPGPEGQPGWYAIENLESEQLVSDLHQLSPRALACFRGESDAFSALTTFDGDGNPVLSFDL